MPEKCTDEDKSLIIQSGKRRERKWDGGVQRKGDLGKTFEERKDKHAKLNCGA